MSYETREETTSPSKIDAKGVKPVVETVLNTLEVKENLSVRWRYILWKSCVYIITLGMLVAMLLGLNMSWSVISAALALVVFDFQDAGPSLEKVRFIFHGLCFRFLNYNTICIFILISNFDSIRFTYLMHGPSPSHSTTLTVIWHDKCRIMLTF